MIRLENNTQENAMLRGVFCFTRKRRFPTGVWKPATASGRCFYQALASPNRKVGFDGDSDVYDIRYTLIHEIGHAIGLDHPGPSGQVMGFRYTEAVAELQPGDLRGVRQLYGQRASTDGLANASEVVTQQANAPSG